MDSAGTRAATAYAPNGEKTGAEKAFRDKPIMSQRLPECTGVRWTRPKLLVVTPARNEAGHLVAVIAAMVRQTVLPDEWRIVDDGSTDTTRDILVGAAERHSWIRLSVLRYESDTGVDGLAAGRPARAFAAGVRDATIDWDFVAKVDADVELPPEYFAVLLDRMLADVRLGMAGGTLIELDVDGEDRVIAVPQQHVPGALSVYRRSCFEQIGGVRVMLGWDTIDETLARMRGFHTQSYLDVVARHRRQTGAVAGVIRGRARHGVVAWIVHYPPYFVLLRAAKLSLLRPRGVLGAAFLWGYLSAAIRRVPRVSDDGFRSHIRQELRQRVLRAGRKQLR
jgi:biofilm PGA synthesis N-glycosyltransferase PgaC